MNRQCYLCLKNIERGEDFEVLDSYSYTYDIEKGEHGYRVMIDTKAVHTTCLLKAKKYFQAIEEGEL